MQEFKTKFTTDISQHQRVMGRLRASFKTTMGYAQKMISITGLAGLAGGGIGITMLGKKVVSLGADMQNTKTAFETMLGSAEKGDRAIAVLNKFADITPYNNEEVIAAGRSLLNIGTTTDDLTKKLTVIGDVAAGAQVPLRDMMNIYAKSANKGRISAQELNQLSERGIPIMQVLADMTGKSTAEVMKLGEKGKLSFALLDEALQKMSSKGGQYFGLMEKQSKNLKGQWSMLQNEIEKIGIAIGEKSIPALSKGVNSLVAKIEEMKATGQLDEIISGIADAIGNTVVAIRDLAKWLEANKENFIAIGKIGLYFVAWQKLNLAMTAVVGTMRALRAVDLAGTFQNLRNSSSTVKILTADMGALVKATGAVRASFMTISAVAATAFSGWEIGKRLGEMLKLEEVFTRLMMSAKDKELENVGNSPVKASVDTRDLVDDRKKLSNLKSEAEQLRKQINDLDGAADQGAASTASEVLRKQLAAKEKEAKELEEASQAYRQAAQKEIASIEQIAKAQRDAQRKANALKAELSRTDRFGGRDRMHELGEVLAQTGGEMSNYGRTMSSMPGVNPEWARLSGELEKAQKAAATLQTQLSTMTKTKSDYQRNIERLNAAEKGEALQAATELSAVEKLRIEEAKEHAEKLLELERANLDARQKLKKAQQAIQDESFRDVMSERINAWRENIEKYQRQITETDRKLARFDILKSVEQIKQDKQDDLLRRKIEAHNVGGKVTFSQEELSRVNRLVAEQRQARAANKSIGTTEGDITGAEKRLNTFNLRRRTEERIEETKRLASQGNALSAVEQQLSAAREANAPIVNILARVEQILKKGLPSETV